MTDVEHIEARWRGLLPDTLGMTLVSVTSEEVVATLVVRDAVCTVGGIAHGGALMAFADTLGAIGTIANLGPDAATATIESKTNFFRPAPLGTTVTGTATPVNRGRRTQTWETAITDANAKLVAKITQTQMVL